MLTDLDYELLSAYIDGMLIASERTAFESRLQAEPELSHELAELRATVTLLNNLPARKAPRDFTLDARYARRSSVFFTSAAFSVLSTAAAILLIALGTYLFTGNKSSTSAPTSNQVGSVAIVPTSNGSTTFDKAAATTATEPLANEVQLATDTPLNSPIVPPQEGAANDGFIQVTPTVLPTSLAGQSSLFSTDIVQATQTIGEMGDTSSSAAASAPSDMQQRTNEATETVTQEESADTSIGGALPAPVQGIPSTPATEAEANASMAFAATQAPSAAIVLPTATATLTLSPTLTASATLTVSATLTSSPTLTPSVTLTKTVTPQPTATLAPLVVQPPVTAPDSLPLILIVLGVVFLLVAIVTTMIRRNSS